mmetsp:Transcript_24409/g.64422  ORF Transcript_24409/g.64422 Transcript_24409/m.64422 type:complete len:101 (+) Transcript_24409:214-516(+)
MGRFFWTSPEEGRITGVSDFTPESRFIRDGEVLDGRDGSSTLLLSDFFKENFLDSPRSFGRTLEASFNPPRVRRPEEKAVARVSKQPVDRPLCLRPESRL